MRRDIPGNYGWGVLCSLQIENIGWFFVGPDDYDRAFGLAECPFYDGL